MKGSITAEASYVIPFCFLVIGMICFLGIYEYNQAVLQLTGYECILKTMEERGQNQSEFQKHLLERANRIGNERILGVEDLDAAIQITASKIALSYEGTQTMLNLPIEVTVVYNKVHPEMTLWLTKGVTGG